MYVMSGTIKRNIPYLYFHELNCLLLAEITSSILSPGMAYSCNMTRMIL
jgi:hypothetical protein